MERSAGILLPIFSLPSPWGIGTLGREAFRFVDFLAAAGQRWWQMLPVGPTGYGDSPYQSFSSFAGNPYFIDLDLLAEEGLLTGEEIEAEAWGDDPAAVDYGRMYVSRHRLLHKAAKRGAARDVRAVELFSAENPWVEDYALFMALKDHFGGLPWNLWPVEGLVKRRPEALAEYREKLAEEVWYYRYLQFLFDGQWKALKEYAAAKGIGIIGDIPIYTAMDSCDVWTEPWFFLLDEENFPIEVAGCPPDAFNDLGQLWGNPLYRWDRMKADGYGWWIRRIDGVSRRCDVIRIDHFLGMKQYWAVPYGAPDARGGRWLPGPGMDLLRVLNGWFPHLKYLAEDLGVFVRGLKELREEAGWPGMKVMEFAFSPDNEFLPHNHEPNSACYIGTHDNDTLSEWAENLIREDGRELAFALEYLQTTRKQLPEAVLRAGLASVSNLFVAQLADYMGLGKEAHINHPGCPEGNWQFRLTAMPDDALAERILFLTRLYGRTAQEEAEEDDEEEAAVL